MYPRWEPPDERAVPTAILGRAYSEMRVLAGRVVVVRLREELSATGVLRPINQRTDMSSAGQPRVLAPISGPLSPRKRS